MPMANKVSPILAAMSEVIEVVVAIVVNFVIVLMIIHKVESIGLLLTCLLHFVLSLP